jgi:hypothetical protein
MDSNSNPIPNALVSLSVSGPGTVISDPPLFAGETDASGVSSWEIKSTVAGSYIITATADSVKLTQQPAVIFNPGPAARLAFTQQPSGGVSGIAFAVQPQITVQDSFGNTVDSSASITLAIGNNPRGASSDR